MSRQCMSEVYIYFIDIFHADGFLDPMFRSGKVNRVPPIRISFKITATQQLARLPPKEWTDPTDEPCIRRNSDDDDPV